MPPRSMRACGRRSCRYPPTRSTTTQRSRSPIEEPRSSPKVSGSCSRRLLRARPGDVPRARAVRLVRILTDVLRGQHEVELVTRGMADARVASGQARDRGSDQLHGLRRDLAVLRRGPGHLVDLVELHRQLALRRGQLDLALAERLGLWIAGARRLLDLHVVSASDGLVGARG